MAFNVDIITQDAFNVTPSDSATVEAYGFITCDGGTVVVETAKGHFVTFTNLPPASQVPLAIMRFMATGTTSKALVAFGPT